MKQLIGVNDYKKLMNFEIKKTCALCLISGSKCDVSHFAPSKSVLDQYSKFDLTEDELKEVTEVLNRFKLIDTDSHSE